MFILPYALCFAGYIWVGKRAWRAPSGVAKIIALIFVIGGAGYTLYKMIGLVGSIMTNDNFEFAIIIVTVFVLFFASVALAMAEPEKK
jgi:high-affinity K+ transport system ATPase subunit B